MKSSAADAVRNERSDMAMKRSSATIAEYLKGILKDRQRALKDPRKKILSAIPEAQKGISYRMPAFRLNGVVVAGFSATARGCSYFPSSDSTLKTLRRDLARNAQTKCSLHLSPGDRSPLTLVRKLIEIRIAETKT